MSDHINELLDVDETVRATIPPPPHGYEAPVEFKYPVWLLMIMSIAILALMAPVVGYLTWWLQGRPESLDFSIDLGQLLIVVVAIILTLVVHELIHGLVARWLGYRVSYGVKWRMGAAYAAAFHQFIERDHNLMIAIAPLIVLTLLFVPLLAVPVPAVVGIAALGLLVNTAGAVGDMYLSWRLLRLPRQTLLYDVSIDCMLIYPPKATAAHEPHA